MAEPGDRTSWLQTLRTWASRSRQSSRSSRLSLTDADRRRIFVQARYEHRRQSVAASELPGGNSSVTSDDEGAAAASAVQLVVLRRRTDDHESGYASRASVLQTDSLSSAGATAAGGDDRFRGDGADASGLSGLVAAASNVATSKDEVVSPGHSVAGKSASLPRPPRRRCSGRQPPHRDQPRLSPCGSDEVSDQEEETPAASPSASASATLPPSSSSVATAAGGAGGDAGSPTSPRPRPLPALPPTNRADDGRIRAVSAELSRLSHCGYYWGPLTLDDTQVILAGRPNGSYLLRDSHSDCYLLAIGFRAEGRTVHTRISHCNGWFIFSHVRTGGAASIDELIANGVLVRGRKHSLLYPVSRLTRMRSLKDFCRLVIRRKIAVDRIDQLEIPTTLKGFLRENPY